MKNYVSLNRNMEFKRLYKKGKSCVRPTLVLYTAPNRQGVNRLGITAGKKVGCAVNRNRAKRRLRELYRLALPRLKEGVDVCLVARVRTVGAEHKKLARDFLTACDSVGILNEKTDD